MKNIIIAPHADDEVLGCGVFMQNNETDVVIMAIGEYVTYEHRSSDVDLRMDELKACHKALGVNKTTILSDLEGTLDTISESKIVGWLDAILSEGYDRVFMPYPSRHIDHRVTYNAVLASLRLRAGKQQEKEVYLYEYPFIMGADHLKGGGVFLPCSELEIMNKVQAFEMYKSQIKPSPSPLNKNGILTLAKMRGMEIGREYAEKYYLQTMIM